MRRVEKTSEAFVGQPNDRLQFQGVQVASSTTVQILQPQPGSVTVDVESHRHVSEFTAYNGVAALVIEMDRHDASDQEPECGQGFIVVHQYHLLVGE